MVDFLTLSAGGQGVSGAEGPVFCWFPCTSASLALHWCWSHWNRVLLDGACEGKFLLPRPVWSPCNLIYVLLFYLTFACLHIPNRYLDFQICTRLSYVTYHEIKIYILWKDTLNWSIPIDQGRIFWDLRLPGVSVAERTALYVAAVEMLAKLHSLDLASLNLEGYGKGSDYCRRQVR